MKKNLFFCIFFLCLSGVSSASSSVIANTSVDAVSVDENTLSRIYAMQLKHWPNGEPIRVFVLPSRNKLHRSFIISKLKMQTHQLDRLWNRLLFTGTGRAPTVVKSETEMLQKIQTTPSSIGYIDEHTDPVGVKVINVGTHDE